MKKSAEQVQNHFNHIGNEIARGLGHKGDLLPIIRHEKEKVKAKVQEMKEAASEAAEKAKE